MIGNDPDHPGSVWGKGYGSWGSLDGDDEAPGYDRTTGAIIVGLDYRFDEEFLVGMPDTDKAGALAVAERIREAMANHPFPNRERQPLSRLTISGGVASLRVDGIGGTELIRHADEALYLAKAAGRNRVFLYRGVEIGDTGRDGDILEPVPHKDERER